MFGRKSTFSLQSPPKKKQMENVIFSTGIMPFLLSARYLHNSVHDKTPALEDQIPFFMRIVCPQEVAFILGAIVLI